jgi:hypothetical protein
MESKDQNETAFEQVQQFAKNSRSRILNHLRSCQLQPIAEILFMEQLGEIGQRVQMFLELALRHEE